MEVTDNLLEDEIEPEAMYGVVLTFVEVDVKIH